MDFFLGDPFQTFDLRTHEEQIFCRSMIRGLRTYSKYQIVLKGNFVSFAIKFKPDGIYRLFGLPLNELTNCDIPTANLDILPVNEIVERMAGEPKPAAQKAAVENYLLDWLNRRSKSSLPACIDYNDIMRNDHLNPVKEIANRLNISVRQAERKFLREIGLNSKAYQSLLRFDALIKGKLQSNSTGWVELTYEHGYYDQMQMIKAFKAYLNISPTQFSPNAYALQ